MSDQANTQEGHANSPSQRVPIWLLATADDLDGLEFDEPIAGLATADFHEASDAYGAAAGTIENPSASAAGRVFLMLSALLLMRLTPESPNDPFAPMAIFSDGARSAIPSDFRAHVPVLAGMAERTNNPILRARLSDVCWLLERNRKQSGLAAIAAYVEIIEGVHAGRLRVRSEIEATDALNHDAPLYLRRALQIGRAAGPDAPETVAARDLTKRLRDGALSLSKAIPAERFCDLDLDFGISDPATIGQELELLLARLGGQDFDLCAGLWRRAARAYRLAKRDQDKNRCLAEAAEQLAAKSEAQGSALVSAQFLADAISQLHGVPGKRDRRKELQHRLVEVQARIPDELSSFKQEFDLREIAESAERLVDKHDLIEMLFAFAALDHSPDPAELAAEAAEAIRAYPLTSIFGMSRLDREGKVISRTAGGGFGDEGDDDAVAAQIAQRESMRRMHAAFGAFEPARRFIVARHYISDDLFETILRNSPFVCPDQVLTFARGIKCFFHGDRVAALCILTPLLEASLRHVLKAHGHDVTTFDAATQTQEDRMIGPLFNDMRSELEAIFGAAIVGDLERVFLSKVGPYIRHSVAHGLFLDSDLGSADAIYACWLIFRLAVLPLYPYREQLRAMLEPC
jgi:hypothetical protein